jgi:hypothetical protein
MTAYDAERAPLVPRCNWDTHNSIAERRHRLPIRGRARSSARYEWFVFWFAGFDYERVIGA